MTWIILGIILYGKITTAVAVYYGVKRRSLALGIMLWLFFPLALFFVMSAVFSSVLSPRAVDRYTISNR